VKEFSEKSSYKAFVMRRIFLFLLVFMAVFVFEAHLLS
jgi:hypothetical protein